MLDSYTEASRLVVFGARLEAGRVGAVELGVEHLLLGFLLLDQGEFAPRVADFLGGTRQSLAIQPEVTPFFTPAVAHQIRVALLELIPAAEPLPTHIDIPLTGEARAALAAASARSAQVDMLELLWGLCSIGAGPVTDALEANGITAAQVDAAIRER